MNDPVNDASRPVFYSLILRTDQWERAVRWYREVLGLRSLIRVPEDQFAQLQAGGSFVVLLGRPDPDLASQRYGLEFEVEDLDAAVARFESANWTYHGPALSDEGFLHITTLDPDGNRLRLFTWPQK